MRVLGLFALFATIAISVYTAYSYYVACKSRKAAKQQKYADWGMIWQFMVTTFASLILVIAFIKDDFTFGYVAEHSTRQMNVFYKIAAFWAGHEGSLLLWLWMLTGFTAVLALYNQKKSDRLKTRALYVSNYIQLFLMVTIIAATNPFKPALGFTETGMGLNPLLMHWAMVLHPPTLFMGYAGLTIPFAFAIAALWDRDASANWIKQAHSWTLFSWFFLTIGIFLGALWAYVVLGWGGYWAWDPVENASILPWFTGTALLHTFTIYRRRGGMKLWAVALASFSFVMCIMATFITRSGLIRSVHAFPDLRWDLTLLFGGLMVTVVALTAYLMQTRQKEFEAKEFFSDFLSKHFTYYLNNLAMVVFTLIVLFATVVPPFFGTELKADFYNRLAEPIGLLYLLLITICPFLGWTKTGSGKLLKQLAIPMAVAAVAAIPIYMNWGSNPMGFINLVVAVFSMTAILQLFYLTANARAKNRDMGLFGGLFSMFKFSRGQAGGYIGHFGIAIMMFGIAGSMLYVQDIPATIEKKPGQVVQVSNYQLEFKRIEEGHQPGQFTYDAVFDLRNRETGKIVRQMKPRFIYHEVQQQQTTSSDILYEPLRDIFVVFNGMDDNGLISLNIKINPLISFVWLGSLILIFGTLIAMWPKAVVVAEEEEEAGLVKKKTHHKEALASQ